jgi:hypothetical protein
MRLINDESPSCAPAYLTASAPAYLTASAPAYLTAAGSPAVEHLE